jgi:hypothetical protein
VAIVKTRYACVHCGAQINAENRQLICSANRSHSWNDVAAFMALNPQVKYEESKPPIVNQPNHVKVEVTVPPRVKQGLESKFGTTSSSTIAGILGMLSEGEVLIVPEADLQRMKELLGKRPESAAEMFGLIYNLSMELETAKLVADEAKKDIAIYEGRNPGAVVVQLGPLYGTVVEKARDQGETAKLYVERVVKTVVDNNWL